MKAFFAKSNKSAASIERLSNSRDASPTHTHFDALTAYPPPQGTNDIADLLVDQRQYHDYDRTQSHPAHVLTRSQSQRVTSRSYSHQPGVNLAAPPQGPIQEQPYQPYQTQSATPAKEQKKTKRSIFGIHSSSKENSPTSPKTVERTSSVLRRPQVPSQQLSIPQYPQIQPPTSPYSSPVQEQYHSSTEQLNFPPRDDTQHEQFYRPQSQLSSPNYSPQQPNFPPHQQYTAFQTPNQSASEIYSPVQSQPTRPAFGPFVPQDLRPASQQSLAPPSPLRQSTQSAELSSPSRFSGQSFVAPPLQPVMGRGDPPNGGTRTQYTQREMRVDESGQTQYVAQQEGRTRMPQQASAAQGRTTPTPRTREECGNPDHPELERKYEELQGKYSKVKKFYFEKEHQVTQLQNTVATQRLSMSKTSLDDTQYTAAFDRLNMQINNFAFNIRKEWKYVPPWLATFVNKDCHMVGQKEMTAVGRACISRWIVDEIFDRYFHSGLEPSLSTQLKAIEKNLRRTGQVNMQTEDQRDDLIAKLSTWRLTTLEGLSDALSDHGPAKSNQAHLAAGLTEKLTAALQMNLSDPPPAGLSLGVSMIIELAVGILRTLPTESRDITIEYYLPGTVINDGYMKLESGLPQLTNPGGASQAKSSSEYSSGEQADRGSMNSLGDGTSSESSTSLQQHQQSIENQIHEASAKGTVLGQSQQQQAKKSGGFLGGLGLGNKKSAAPSSASNAGSAGSGLTIKDVDREADAMAMMGDREGRIRFAVFVAVEVRGKGRAGSDTGVAATGASGSGATVANVLVRAPCYGF